MSDGIKPIRTYTDEDGIWWVVFNEKEFKEAILNHETKMKKGAKKQNT